MQGQYYSDHLSHIPLIEYMQQLKSTHVESTFSKNKASIDQPKPASSSAFFKTKLCPFLITVSCLTRENVSKAIAALMHITYTNSRKYPTYSRPRYASTTTQASALTEKDAITHTDSLNCESSIWILVPKYAATFSKALASLEATVSSFTWLQKRASITEWKIKAQP